MAGLTQLIFFLKVGCCCDNLNRQGMSWYPDALVWDATVGRLLGADTQGKDIVQASVYSF